MPIDEVFQISGRGIITTGRVESGMIYRGDNLILLGFGRNIAVKAAKINIYREELDSAQTGDYVGILLTENIQEDISRGMMLVKPNNIRQTNNFRASIDTPTFLNTTIRPFLREDILYSLFMYTIEVPITVKMIKDNSHIVEINSKIPIPIKRGWKFVLRDETKIVATGTIK